MSSAQPPTASENDATAQPTYKDQLDEVADKVKDPDQGNTNEGGVVNQVVEKVSEYVPAVGTVLGKGKNEGSAPGKDTQASGPPDRPHHDTQIEEFVRDQHRSKKEDAELATE